VPDVRIVYRRDGERMPAYRHEREHAVHEGVHFEHRVQPLAFEGNGRLEAVRLTALDDRLEPVGDPFRLPADLAAVAIGQARLEEWLGEIPGLEFDGGRLIVDPASGGTANPKYWAGGDLANGGAEVVNAAAEGKRAAHGIDAALRGSSGGLMGAKSLGKTR
jgi:glutamate synthase (NADPH/NADH) small chain